MPDPRLLRVLVVDDHVDSAESLALLLTLEGFEAACAHDGPAALSMFESQRPHAVLLDLHLPAMDGLEVARCIRALPGGADALLVALSGRTRDADRKAALAAGFDAYLSKPAEPAAIVRLLERLR